MTMVHDGITLLPTSLLYFIRRGFSNTKKEDYAIQYNHTIRPFIGIT